MIPEAKKTQLDRFKEAARQLERDEISLKRILR